MRLGREAGAVPSSEARTKATKEAECRQETWADCGVCDQGGFRKVPLQGADVRCGWPEGSRETPGRGRRPARPGPAG